MRALWIEDGVLSLREDAPVPDPPSGEALVRVHVAGICNTDLELLKGYSRYTGIPGHEFVGTVERGPGGLVGQRVVGEINATCGRCRACAAGRASHCQQRTVLGIADRQGAFAEYLALPTGNLHSVPAGMTDEEATFVEPLAAALEIQEQIGVHPDSRVLVVGDGKLGQLIARVLALTGCDLTAVGRHEDKLSRLRERGIRTCKADDVEAAGHDLVVECTGHADGFFVARRGVRPRGAIVMKSTYAGDLTLDAASLVVDEVSLIGSRCGPFAPALRLLASQSVEVEDLIHARFSLDEGPRAFDRARRPGTLKVLLEVGPT